MGQPASPQRAGKLNRTPAENMIKIIHKPKPKDKCSHCENEIRYNKVNSAIELIMLNGFCRKCALWIWGQLDYPEADEVHIFTTN